MQDEVDRILRIVIAVEVGVTVVEATLHPILPLPPEVIAATVVPIRRTPAQVVDPMIVVNAVVTVVVAVVDAVQVTAVTLADQHLLVVVKVDLHLFEGTVEIAVLVVDKVLEISVVRVTAQVDLDLRPGGAQVVNIVPPERNVSRTIDVIPWIEGREFRRKEEEIVNRWKEEMNLEGREREKKGVCQGVTVWMSRGEEAGALIGIRDGLILKVRVQEEEKVRVARKM